MLDSCIVVFNSFFVDFLFQDEKDSSFSVISLIVETWTCSMPDSRGKVFSPFHLHSLSRPHCQFYLCSHEAPSVYTVSPNNSVHFIQCSMCRPLSGLGADHSLQSVYTDQCSPLSSLLSQYVHAVQCTLCRRFGAVITVRCIMSRTFSALCADCSVQYVHNVHTVLCRQPFLYD